MNNIKKEKLEGLNYPSIDKLLQKIDSKYKLAYLSSKIAHCIKVNKIELPDTLGKKTLTKALNEIINDNFEIVFK
ncbi:DNA-directed RNA polymerase subunit omega [Candidatus Phytoplasma palmae]|uniref:DNA-directed RNA polymerase subunit omega n=1 Tax=Candidatus Phytoplasma palmae TaxID=85624 RepID=UPI003990BB4E